MKFEWFVFCGFDLEIGLRLAMTFLCVLLNADCNEATQITLQKPHVTLQNSHAARHTSHVKRHKSHVTRHTSHVTHLACYPVQEPAESIRHKTEKTTKITASMHASRAKQSNEVFKAMQTKKPKCILWEGREGMRTREGSARSA